ncbi:unnamed protein product, partial [Citrullus colocynthis]
LKTAAQAAAHTLHVACTLCAQPVPMPKLTLHAIVCSFRPRLCPCLHAMRSSSLPHPQALCDRRRLTSVSHATHSHQMSPTPSAPTHAYPTPTYCLCCMLMTNLGV